MTTSYQNLTSFEMQIKLNTKEVKTVKVGETYTCNSNESIIKVKNPVFGSWRKV